MARKRHVIALVGPQENEEIVRDEKLSLLESKFERREADLLKEIDSLRSMVLGIVEVSRIVGRCGERA